LEEAEVNVLLVVRENLTNPGIVNISCTAYADGISRMVVSIILIETGICCGLLVRVSILISDPINQGLALHY